MQNANPCFNSWWCYVSAGNESCPQPQTSEHLAAIEIMKLKHIIILQNKIDLVKEIQAQEQYEQILRFVQGKYLFLFFRFWITKTGIHLLFHFSTITIGNFICRTNICVKILILGTKWVLLFVLNDMAIEHNLCTCLYLTDVCIT